MALLMIQLARKYVALNVPWSLLSLSSLLPRPPPFHHGGVVGYRLSINQSVSFRNRFGGNEAAA